MAISACAGTAEQDARFAAGWRPSKAECVFGGATPTIDAYCARRNFGAEGVAKVLRDHNQRMLVAGHTLRCTDHVARLRAVLAVYGDEYRLQELYSCDRDAPVGADGRRICHVSLLVTDAATGARFVADNGHVLAPGTTGGVAPYREFAQRVDHAWTGETPAWMVVGTH